MLDYINDLKAIRRQLREKHPDQRCLVDVTYSNPNQILDSGADTAIIRFSNDKVPVFSYYTVISPSSNLGTFSILVGINHVPYFNVTGFSGNGIWVEGGTVLVKPLIIKSEIQYLVIRIADDPINVGYNAKVNGTGDSVIKIYGWTLSEDGQVNGLH